MPKSSLLATGLVPAIALAMVAASPGLAHEPDAPHDFIFIGGDRLSDHRVQLETPGIEGAQIVYSWRMLEPAEGQYDFSMIEADLAVAQAAGRKLFIQIQDRFFSAEARLLPDYILNEPQYGGGLARQYDNPGEGQPVAHGWTTMQWNAEVRARFQALLHALGERFDGHVAGINLPETSFDRVEGQDPQGFTCDTYFASALDNMAALRTAFTRSAVVQYVNFWPCEWNNDHSYMERAFAFAVEHRIGLGGPDIVPFRRGQMKNSYPFFNAHKGELPLVAMAVQEPTLTYTNPQTGKPFTRSEFEAFARDYLGVDIIFWSVTAPWLQTVSGETP